MKIPDIKKRKMAERADFDECSKITGFFKRFCLNLKTRNVLDPPVVVSFIKSIFFKS